MREYFKQRTAQGEQTELCQPEQKPEPRTENMLGSTAEGAPLIEFAGGMENRDDIIMLYLPCLVICTMIVCIVSSAVALGHV